MYYSSMLVAMHTCMAILLLKMLLYFTKNFDIPIKYRKKVKMMTQESVRNKLLEKTYAFRQKNISEATGIPVEIISKFMNGKRELYDSSLQDLNEYLDSH